jgi:ketosteroid isomerase-like protein
MTLPLNELRMFSQYVEETFPGACPSLHRRRPFNLGFSLVEHVCHLRDYESSGVLERMEKILAEETPLLQNFPGDQLAVERDYRNQDLASALRDFVNLRAKTVAILETLSDTQLRRTAVLGDEGTVNLARFVEIVAEHDRTHRQEINELLAEIQPRDPNSDQAALRQMARDFAEGFNSGDVARLMRYYGECYVDQNLRHPVQTWAERKAYFEKLIRRNDFQLAVFPDEIVIRGAIAFVRGRIELLRKDAAPTELRYMEITAKTNDGWKAVWGMDGPVQE